MNLKQIFLVLLLGTAGTSTFSQRSEDLKHARTHNIVMQVTEGDSLSQVAVAGQIRNIKRSLPDASIEVVCHAKALDLVLKNGSKVKELVSELIQMNVRFVACENTMTRLKVTKNELLPGIETVPSGLVEIILKQEDGWSYVKGGH